MANVRQVALELLECDKVTLFLIFERRRELRWALVLLGVGVAERALGSGALAPPTHRPKKPPTH